MSDDLPYECGHCGARYYGEQAAETCCDGRGVLGP